MNAGSVSKDRSQDLRDSSVINVRTSFGFSISPAGLLTSMDRRARLHLPA